METIRESYLSEADLTPNKEDLFYPQAKRKERAIMRESKVNDRTSFQDQVCGILNPIVYALNKGKNILPNSLEHRILKDLLNESEHMKTKAEIVQILLDAKQIDAEEAVTLLMENRELQFVPYPYNPIPFYPYPSTPIWIVDPNLFKLRYYGIFW